MIICPVCETENRDDAVVCECCGERLAPPAPGEEVGPESMMAASVQAVAVPAGLPPGPPPAAKAGFAPIDEEFAALGDAPALDEAAMKAKLAALAAEVPKPAPAPPAASAPVVAPVVNKPAVLYSSLSGKAYVAGTPEYAEGFGPMGEELVATPPAGVDMRSTIPVGVQLRAQDVIAAANAAPPRADEAVYAVRTQPMAGVAPAPAAPVIEPPKPAVQAGAKLTVYHQRQPVHTHMITTDEVLLGRTDVRADILPDVDLTQWDEAGHVSRKHAYIYRQNRVYTLYAVSNGGVQLNKELLEIGDKRELRDGDIIVLAGAIAIKFEKV
jgi:hypothetical protein